jgi:transposase-like protein
LARKKPAGQRCQDIRRAFYDFPAEHWVHLRTSKPVESIFGLLRHRTDQTRGCVTRDMMRAFIYKPGMCAENR